MKHCRFALMLAALATMLVTSASAALDPALLIRLATSVLKVEVIRAQGGYSLGSGVVVDAERVVTNCHVTRDARRIAVLQGGLRLPAQAQQVDAYHDLCLLHVPGIDAGRAVRLAESSRLAVGQPLTAVGHTAGALQSSTGEVLALHRMDDAQVIQSSNFFNSGASGGGLFDAQSRLVGILTFRLRGDSGRYFAIPAQWFARQLQDSSDPGEPIGPQSAQQRAFWEQPLDEQPLFLRAAVLQRDGNWSALQPLATDWARRDASDPEPWYLLGLALDRQDQRIEAMHALECSLTIAPDFESARAELQRITLGQDPTTATETALPCRL